MAVALAIKKDYENAVSVYLAAIEIQPDLAEAYNGLGICYYHLKKYDLAWENLKKARMMGFEVQENFYEAVGRKAN
jgi:tetratricopeptide (TPR) repeat protein